MNDSIDHIKKKYPEIWDDCIEAIQEKFDNEILHGDQENESQKQP